MYVGKRNRQASVGNRGTNGVSVRGKYLRALALGDVSCVIGTAYVVPNIEAKNHRFGP
jgi:hypothetical protein